MPEPTTPPADPTPTTPPAPKPEPASGGTKPEPTTEPATQTFTQADLDRIVADRINRERKKFADYDDLKKAAAAQKPLEDQIAEMRKQLDDRAAAEVTRNGQLALAQVHAKLAESGIKKDDVALVLEKFDPVSLLKDGQPDATEIDKFATALSKVAGRTTHDPDQGRKGGQPTDMNSLIRGMANRT